MGAEVRRLFVFYPKTDTPGPKMHLVIPVSACYLRQLSEQLSGFEVQVIVTGSCGARERDLCEKHRGRESYATRKN